MAFVERRPSLRALNQDRRRFQRVKVDLLGRYMLADRREFPCQVINMSPGGMALIAPVGGAAGDRVIAYVDHLGRLEGHIARIIENAPSVTVSFVPEAGRLAAKLEVLCRNPQQANDLAAQLAATTELARSLFAREHQTPNPADFSGLVTSGVFRTEGSRLLGTWPLERAFVQNLLGTQ